MAFDTLTYAKKLQEAGVPPQQAEAHAGALKELVEGNLATRPDIEELRAATKQDLKEVEARLVHEIELVRRDMELMRRVIIIWLGGLIIVATTTLGVLMKLL